MLIPVTACCSCSGSVYLKCTVNLFRVHVVENPRFVISSLVAHFFALQRAPSNFRPALLPEEARRCASRLCALLFLPALVISSTGGTLTPAGLRDSWQLVVVSSFTILVSNFTAWAFARALLGPEDRITYRPVQLAIAFQNPAAFPLLLVASLCEQDDIKR